MQHYLGCENVTLAGLKIWNHSNKNNDMMGINGCKNVTIINIIGDSDDDAIALKSKSPRESENITMTNCIISSHQYQAELIQVQNSDIKNIEILGHFLMLTTKNKN